MIVCNIEQDFHVYTEDSYEIDEITKHSLGVLGNIHESQ